MKKLTTLVLCVGFAFAVTAAVAQEQKGGVAEKTAKKKNKSPEKKTDKKPEPPKQK